jgi:chromosome segregation ATPase
LEYRLKELSIPKTQEEDFEIIKELEDEIKDLKYQISDLKLQIDYLESQTSAKEEELEKKDKIIAEEVKKRNDEVNEKEEEIKRKNEEISLKNDEIVSKEAELIEKDTLLVEKASEIAAKEAQIKDLQGTITNFRSQPPSETAQVPKFRHTESLPAPKFHQKSSNSPRLKTMNQIDLDNSNELLSSEDILTLENKFASIKDDNDTFKMSRSNTNFSGVEARQSDDGKLFDIKFLQNIQLPLVVFKFHEFYQSISHFFFIISL